MAIFNVNASRKLSVNFQVDADSAEEAAEIVQNKMNDQMFEAWMRNAGFAGVITVSISEKSLTHNRYTGPTGVQKFLEWFNNLPEGAEFTSRDIKAIGGNVAYIVNKAPACKTILERCFVKRGQYHVIYYRKGGVVA